MFNIASAVLSVIMTEGHLLIGSASYSRLNIVQIDKNMLQTAPKCLHILELRYKQ